MLSMPIGISKAPDKVLIAVERAIGLKGTFAEFVKMTWLWIVPAPLEWSWHLDLICSHYEACFQGEIPSIVVNIPPGCSKSILTNVFFPAWAWLRNPDLRWIFASGDQTLVNRDARMSLDLMSCQRAQVRWPDRFRFPKRNQAIEEIHNAFGGWRIGTTPGGKAIGWHANFQVFDDLVKPAELTPVVLGNVEQWRSETMATRWLPAPALNCRIMIAQRLHEDDPPAHELSEGAVHLMIPMQFDPERKCSTGWGSDPRTEPGELLQSERFPQDRVDKLRAKLRTIAAAAQLDQNPVPKGGLLFTDEMLERTWSAQPDSFDQVILSADCTFKGTDDSDYVVIQVWGLLGPDFYLLDQTREQMGFWKTCEEIVRIRNAWPNALGILIEDKANGSAVIETLQKTIPGIIAVNPAGGKEARANAVQPLFQSKNVVLPAHAAWLEDYRVELKRFPRGKKDDQVDATSQALLYLQQNIHYLTGLDEAMKDLPTGFFVI
jgi:predicted phage terminase large subunit-like protein